MHTKSNLPGILSHGFTTGNSGTLVAHLALVRRERILQQQDARLDADLRQPWLCAQQQAWEWLLHVHSALVQLQRDAQRAEGTARVLPLRAYDAADMGGGGRGP